MKSFLTSSSDPSKLGRTVQGFLTALIPLFVIFSGMSAAELTPVIDSVVTLVVAVTSVAAAAQVAYGLLRKVYLQRWSAK